MKVLKDQTIIRILHIFVLVIPSPLISIDYISPPCTGTLDSCKAKAVQYSEILLKHAQLSQQQRLASAHDAQKLQAMDL